MLSLKNVDHGKTFDWGNASDYYAKFRDIYPEEFYEKLLEYGIGTACQSVLDVGTGTGVIPRNMYKYGARFKGIDIAENQIEKAKELAKKGNMDIEFSVSPAEEMPFADDSFDAAVASQCFFYFNHDISAPTMNRVLKNGGLYAVTYMAWLPFEDEIAKASEDLVLKYNPKWTGCGERRHDVFIPEVYEWFFDLEETYLEDVSVPFTRESWNGRIMACRGIGASLSPERVDAFSREHMKLLEEIAPEEFKVKHYITMTLLKNKK